MKQMIGKMKSILRKERKDPLAEYQRLRNSYPFRLSRAGLTQAPVGRPYL